MILNKSVVIVETNSLQKLHIKTINDNQNHIHDVVVVETNVVVDETNETNVGIIVTKVHELDTWHGNMNANKKRYEAT
jgi:hypothetical protein